MPILQNETGIHTLLQGIVLDQTWDLTFQRSNDFLSKRCEALNFETQLFVLETICTSLICFLSGGKGKMFLIENRGFLIPSVSPISRSETSFTCAPY